MHMQADQLQVVQTHRVERRAQLGMPDAMFALLATGIGLVAVAMAEAGVDAQPDWVARGCGTELMQHVNRSGIDRDLVFDDRGERLRVEQVGGEDDLSRLRARLETGRQRTQDLAARHRVDLHALLAHQPQDMGVRAGFLCKSDHIEAGQCSNARTDDGSVIDPERRAETIFQ